MRPVPKSIEKPLNLLDKSSFAFLITELQNKQEPRQRDLK